MAIKKIIGNGFIGRNVNKLRKYIIKSDYIIYTAGISNSNTNSKKELKKEIRLFKDFSKENNSKKLIFISTADVSNNLKRNNPYIINKVKIENIIKKEFKDYIILRLPQIIGNSKNKKTLINYFYRNIKKNKTIDVLSGVKRNILDIDDVIKVLKIIIFEKKLMKRTITLSNNYYVQPIDIVKIFEKKLNKVAKVRFKRMLKEKWNLENDMSKKLFNKAKVKFDKNYLIKKINKYF